LKKLISGCHENLRLKSQWVELDIVMLLAPQHANCVPRIMYICLYKRSFL